MDDYEVIVKALDAMRLETWVTELQVILPPPDRLTRFARGSSSSFSAGSGSG